MMDVFLIILAGIFLVIGLLGAVIPILPGLPFSYIGLLLLHFSSKIEFTLTFLIVWLIVVIVLQVLDNVLPAWGAKYFGGSKWGVWGSFVGLFIGLFFGPIGILLGSFLGAVVGELIYGKPIEEAARSGFGTFIGFIASTIAKLIISGLFIFYYIKELVNIL
ncbi:MAG: DUF456 domain-containing protein [Paludibacteraceae bacterium]|nr:DUF456 domain-containing protein [Paludibacteraceae bacterium]